MNFSLVQLQYLVSLDNHRNFVTAAEECNVTQPTLSMQIKKMEDDYGIVIFDRTQKPLKPTSLGEDLIKQAKIILNEAEILNQKILIHKDILSGTIHIGVIPTLAQSIVPLFSTSFLQKYPNFKLKIKEIMTENMVEDLKNNRLDIGIAATPLKLSFIEEVPLFYESIKVYAPKIKRNTVSIEELKKQKIWMLNEGNCLREQTMNICNIKNKNELQFEYESGSIFTLLKMVDKEGGITYIPELFLEDINNDKKQHIKSIEKENPQREVSLIFAKNFAKKHLVKIIEKEILKALPSKIIKAKKQNVLPIK